MVNFNPGNFPFFLNFFDPNNMPPLLFDNSKQLPPSFLGMKFSKSSNNPPPPGIFDFGDMPPIPGLKLQMDLSMKRPPPISLLGSRDMPPLLPSRDQLSKFGDHITEKNPAGATRTDLQKHVDHHSDSKDPTYDPVKAASARFTLDNFSKIDTNRDQKVTGTEIKDYSKKLPPGPPGAQTSRSPGPPGAGPPGAGPPGGGRPPGAGPPAKK